MSFDFSRENDAAESKKSELDSLLTSVVQYRRPRPDQDLDEKNKKIQHMEMIRKFGKKVKKIANTNVPAQSVSR